MRAVSCRMFSVSLGLCPLDTWSSFIPPGFDEQTCLRHYQIVLGSKTAPTPKPLLLKVVDVPFPFGGLGRHPQILP